MGDRGRELPHRCDAVRVRQLRLRLAVASLALARLGFRPLALGQIENEGDAAVFEARRSDQYGDTAAVLPEILLFVRWKDSGRLQFGHSPRIDVAPFGRR